MTQTKAELLQTRHQGDIRLGDADSTHYVGFKAPATVGTSLVWTLPAADGTANYLLKTDGSGNLGWVADSSTDSTKMPLAGGTFTGNVTYNDNIRARFGTNADLSIYHNDTNAYIDNDKGDLILQSDSVIRLVNSTNNESYIKCFINGTVELYNDNDRKFYTSSSGAQVENTTGDTYLVIKAEEDSSSADPILRLLASNDSTSPMIQFGDSSDSDVGLIKYKHSDNSICFGMNAVYDSIIFDSNGNIVINSDSYLKIGAGQDLQLTHNGSHNYVNGTNGHLYLRADQIVVAGNTTGETIAQFVENGAAIFRYDNVVKFETTSAGTKFTGGIAQVATAAGALELDLNTSNYFTKTISGNSTFTFANPAASGQVTAFTLELTHSSGTVTWPSSVKWNADTAPTLTTGKTHLFMFVTDDGGSRYRGSALVDYVN